MGEILNVFNNFITSTYMHLIKRASILHGKKHGNKIVDKISRSIGI